MLNDASRINSFINQTINQSIDQPTNPTIYRFIHQNIWIHKLLKFQLLKSFVIIYLTSMFDILSRGAGLHRRSNCSVLSPIDCWWKPQGDLTHLSNSIGIGAIGDLHAKLLHHFSHKAAFLSFSTSGSAKHDSLSHIKDALELAKSKG